MLKLPMPTLILVLRLAVQILFSVAIQTILCITKFKGAFQMMLFILRNGSFFPRIVVENDEANYALLQVADSDVPLYPESEAGRGKSWELQHVDGVSYLGSNRPGIDKGRAH
jgi:hypothetical protein